MKWIWCFLFHRQHWKSKIIGLYDSKVFCEKCRRSWTAN
jgi:hypothetical protein